MIKKLLLLFKIYLLKYRLIKIVLVAKAVPLNEYSSDLLDDVSEERFDYVFESFRYKRISDPTGEYRFYIPTLNPHLVYRIDQKLGIKNKLPIELELLEMKHGRKQNE